MPARCNGARFTSRRHVERNPPKPKTLAEHLEQTLEQASRPQVATPRHYGADPRHVRVRKR